MRRLLREPLLHFLLLGLLLLAARATLLPVVEARLNPPTIRVSAAQVESLQARWRAQTGRAADAKATRALIRDYVDDELLFREARRRNLQRSDTVVRAWLIRSMRFTNPDTNADDAALLKTAWAMGMDARDPVVRRRLIERMRQRIESRAQVSKAQVRGWLAAHPETRDLATRYRFRQVFFSRDVRGADAPAAARQALTRLRGAQPPPIGQLGDPLLLGNRFTAATRADIVRRFGTAFAAQVIQAPVGAWVGPVTSAYGLHLIRVEAAVPGGRARPADRRARAVSRLYREQEHKRLQTALTRLRQRYRIVIEAPAPLRAAQL